MTERFRMPMTWEIDRARAFVGGSVYHSCLGTGDCLLKGWSKLAGNALRCDFNNTAPVCTKVCASKCVMGVFSLVCARVSAQKFPVCQWQ